jgi:hypothetical protein
MAFCVLLNELFDLSLPESRELTEADAREERRLSGYVIVNPCLADTQPVSDFIDREEPTMVACLLVGRLPVGIQCGIWGRRHQNTPRPSRPKTRPECPS